MNTLLKRQLTPENIKNLPEREIFVFGSNLNGNHAGGAAKTALDKFGAIQGQAEGLQGQSYALPTLDENMSKLSLEAISKHIDTLYQFAESCPDLVFWVTKIGCGIAGFDEQEIARLFKEKETPFNVFLPEEFTVIRGFKAFDKGLVCRGFQYEENTEYVHNGEVEACESGFHFCENPFDVFNFYKPSESEFAEVEGWGDIDISEHNKIAVSHLKVKNKMSVQSFIDKGIDFTRKKVQFFRDRVDILMEENTDNNAINSGGRYSINSGEYYSVNSGADNSVNSGGNYSVNIGGNYSVNIGGNYSVNSGADNSVNIGGRYSINSGGDNSVNSGEDNSINIGGDSSINIGGDSSMCAGRHKSEIILNGSNSFGIAGKSSKIKGKKGCAICLVQYNNNYQIIGGKSAIIDGEILKEDTYYKLENGEFVECN